MLTKPEQLPQQLPKSTLPMVWISGDEPLLMQEACDCVRQFAREQGFSERVVLDAGNGFNWEQLLAAGSDLSLFSERKLIDLRILSPKVDEAAREALKQYLENPNPDNLLLMTTPRVDKAAQNTKWFKTLEAQALFCQVWPVNEQQLPAWLAQRLKRLGMQADSEVVGVLCDKVEGNLLAAAQEVEKLRILCEGRQLDAGTVLAAVEDSSRYNIFALTDACLSGNTERALKILTHLQAEGEQCLFILNMLCRELRGLSAMLDGMAAGHNIHGVLQSHRVWKNRSQQVTRALQHHSQNSLLRLLERARRVDQSVKGLLELEPWDELTDLVIGFSDSRLLVGVV